MKVATFPPLTTSCLKKDWYDQPLVHGIIADHAGDWLLVKTDKDRLIRHRDFVIPLDDEARELLKGQNIAVYK